MTDIGHFALSNDAGMYVCAMDILWWDADGNKHTVQGAATDIALYKCKSADPGAHGVPDGSKVTMRLDVKSAQQKDITASEQFTYRSGNTSYANYAAGGTTFKPDLTFVSVGGNLCDQQASAAQEAKTSEPASD